MLKILLFLQRYSELLDLFSRKGLHHNAIELLKRYAASLPIYCFRLTAAASVSAKKMKMQLRENVYSLQSPTCRS